MRRSLTPLALFAVAALAAACSSSTAPGWTYAAPTSPPPSQPAASGSAAPASGPPAVGIGAVQISAVNVQFDPKEVSAPAGVAFVIHFDNKDAGQPHNIEIKDGTGAQVFKGDLVTGPASADYQIPALTAGTYPFVCTVHANMQGTLTAG